MICDRGALRKFRFDCDVVYDFIIIVANLRLTGEKQKDGKDKNSKQDAE